MEAAAIRMEFAAVKLRLERRERVTYILLQYQHMSVSCTAHFTCFHWRTAHLKTFVWSTGNCNSGEKNGLSDTKLYNHISLKSNINLVM